ncbi:MAG: hypothetical protein QXL96_07215 [Ignisphaera sp.]
MILYAFTSTQLDIDPAPLIKIFQDVMEVIINRNYSNALTLCRKASNISLPKDIAYIHIRLYKYLERLVYLLMQINDVKTLGTVDRQRVYAILNDLHITRLELVEVMNNYVNKLSSLFKDSTVKHIVLESLTDYVLNFDGEIESISTELIQLYLDTYGQYIYIELHNPHEVYGGEELNVNILLITNHDIDYVNLTLVLIYGNVLSQSYSYFVPVGKNIKINITTPNVEDIIIVTGLEPKPKINSKLIVIAKALNGKFFGYRVSSFQLVYLYPYIRISVPTFVRSGQEIEVNISADLDYSLNLLVYLNSISKNNLLANLTLSTGKKTLMLSSEGLSAGYNKLIFITEPKGKYLAYKYSYDFIKVLNKTVAYINVKPLLIIPPMRPMLEIYVDSPINYNVTIYVDNKIVTRYESMFSPKIIAELNLPLTFFFWRYRISVEIRPNNPNYSTKVLESSIYVFNMATLTIIPIFILVAIATPSKINYVVTTIRLGSRTIKGAISRNRNASTTNTNIIKYIYRESQLFGLYKRIIAIISRYVEPPRPSETLREFYCRLSKSSVNSYILSLLKTFLELYEKDLYSNRYVDIVEAANIVKRIEETENK